MARWLAPSRWIPYKYARLIMEAGLAHSTEAIGRAIDAGFDELLPIPTDGRAQLYQAMRHACIGGGKRLRPLLVCETAALFDVPQATALPVALAVECIHVYSLIHDDLPCMDDDDLRRGKPTVHRAFDEATAVLAGDALHALAFALLAKTEIAPPLQSALVAALAKAAGPEGMAGGQMLDLAAEGKTLILADIQHLQRLKTGALIEFAVNSGAILGEASTELSAALHHYAAAVGMAFQIADDLLDHQGDAAIAGKALNKDAAAGKATFVSLLGAQAAEDEAGRLAREAIDALAPFGPKADLLRAIARYTVGRDR